MTESRDAEASVTQKLIRLLDPDETPLDSLDTVRIAERVFEAMRVRLSLVLGNAGYSTLLARAIELARPAFPWIAEVSPDRTGSLSGRLKAAVHEKDPAEAARAFAAVVARFTGLLTTFIGMDLTNRLLESVWQEWEAGNADERPGENNQ